MFAIKLIVALLLNKNCFLFIYDRNNSPGNYVNSSNAGLIVPVTNFAEPFKVYLCNSHNKNISVLLFVRSYLDAGEYCVINIVQPIFLYAGEYCVINIVWPIFIETHQLLLLI